MAFRRFLAPLALSTLLLARTAAAQEGTDSPVAAPPAVAVATTVTAPAATPSTPSSHWYGWQTLASDAATTLSTIGLANVHSLATNNNGGVILTNLGLGFGLGGPLVHVAHGRPLIALLDLAMRAGGVALGGLIGGVTANPHAEYDMGQMIGILAGAFMGATAAVVVDATALSWEKGAPAKTTTVGLGFTVEPTLGWAPGGGTLGVQGTF